MQTNKKYLLLSLITIFTVMGMTLGVPGFAQSTQSDLSCTVETSPIEVNQTTTITATGGDGAYVWSGQNLNITNPVGTQFMVSYTEAGVYPVTVTSAGQTATCDVVVSVNTGTGNLTCSPATQDVILGQSASFAASGGDGTYVWSSSDLTIANPNGVGFTANYASAGTKTITVTSDGSIATCTTNVIANNSNPAPGFPNTGGGYSNDK